MRARVRLRRGSSNRPVRTASAAASISIDIRARNARSVARSTLSGRSGSTYVLITYVHTVPTATAPIIHGSSEMRARRYSVKK
ncbi:hypothetical protein BN971_04904 [Mycobacterium bohemicum DSM 44277]|uniref:Uncharacterized protein n=1 Tax=Mycobacterium bohemicum DSM 44277 TaxID=1236609 RepID=A0A0U0WG18_MYCBE|nr:hypothetical protein BN971_04904 [Mycobacterium bohemicum DSM 44277]